MKYQVTIIMLLGLCSVSILQAMEGELNEDYDFMFFDIPVGDLGVPGAQQGSDGLVSAPTAGYRNLQQELQTLYTRIRNTSGLLQRPLDIQYVKYHSRLLSKKLDKSDPKSSRLCHVWAGKVRAINEAPYLTIMLKSYPKTLASIITLVSGAVLAGVGYGGYKIFEYYNNQEQEQEGEDTPDESGDHEPPALVVDTAIEQ